MTTIEHTQSLADFSRSATQTVDRLNQTGEIEFLTVDGQTKAVVLSPAVYEELSREVMTSRDVAAIKESIQQLDCGEFMSADAFFDQVHDSLICG